MQFISVSGSVKAVEVEGYIGRTGSGRGSGGSWAECRTGWGRPRRRKAEKGAGSARPSKRNQLGY